MFNDKYSVQNANSEREKEEMMDEMDKFDKKIKN